MTTDSAPTCPVRDWEYSLGEVPGHTGFALFDAIGSDEPIFRTQEGPGYYVAADAATITEVMQDPVRFSSTSVVPIEPDPQYLWIPIMLDPPRHTTWRRLMAPHFTPRRVAELSEAVRRRCADLVEEIADRGSADFITDFARRFPTSIFLELLGLPIEQLDRLLEWETLMTHASNATDPDRSKMMQAMNDVLAYFAEVIAERRAEPPGTRDDMLSDALSWSIDGEPIPDTEVAGCPIKAGETILLAIAAAGRDPIEYENPQRVDFDRPAFRHLAFGVGPHRCVGSHLARHEMAVVLDEWHKRIPEYSLAPDAVITEHHAGTWGLDRLPLVWPV